MEQALSSHIPAPPRKAARDVARHERRVRLHTLVRLRWLAVIGQLAAVLVVGYGLGFAMPLWPALAIIAATAWLNVMLTVRWRATLRLRETYAALLLAFDLVQLAGLLYLTGGLQNPFALLFLVPVTIAAASLSAPRVLLIGALALALITLLAFFHFPLPWWPGRAFALPPLYLAGVWGALVSGVLFIGFYAWRIARESRDLGTALSAAELALARQQRLHALNGLAAAAAHELGTPLATITVAAREMRRACQTGVKSAEERKALCEDLDLLVEQAERCRDILARLADPERAGDAMLASATLAALLDEIVEPLRGPDLDIRLHVAPIDGAAAKPPLIMRDPGLLYGLANLIENACDFAERRVEIEAGWSDEEVAVTIADDGPGFAEAVIDRLGEPYVTTRGYGRLKTDRQPEDETGMGLGFFIAKTLLERSGATIGLANRAAPAHGAIVRIVWPRRRIEAGDPAI
ncbi:MAG TPA: ActS/PrrB/RegB family redox-sensitive histidine kinase [Thermopetrobacter sp.]|nr:ActS/PrrB/RegB family redox-sensitive histidine kinase [Thermopetrobacter sp.]